MKNTYLKHYASEYYDPVKAHEYYEEHKKLKGGNNRKLNEKGQEAKLYVTKQINDIRESETNKTKAYIEEQETQKDSKLESAASQNQAKIDQLRNLILSTPESEMKTKGAMYKKQLARLQEDNKKERVKVLNEYKENVKNARNNLKSLKESLKNKLKEELNKMLNDSDTSTGDGDTNTSISTTKAMDKETLERIKKRSTKMENDIKEKKNE